MNAEFQVSMVGYQHEVMRREIRRVAGKWMRVPRWKHWYYSAGRVYILAVLVLSAMTFALLLLGMVLALFQGEAADWSAELVPGVVAAALLFFIPVLLPLGVIVGARKPDPIREQLWPMEAPVVTATFFAEWIQVDDPRVVSQLKYTSVLAVMETGEAYYLFVGQEHMLMLRKFEFTLGGPEQFREFIQQKTGKTVEFVK